MLRLDHWFKMASGLNERRLARNRAHLRQLTDLIFAGQSLSAENRRIVQDFGMRTLEFGAYLTAFPEDARRKLDLSVPGRVGRGRGSHGGSLTASARRFAVSGSRSASASTACSLLRRACGLWARHCQATALPR